MNTIPVEGPRSKVEESGAGSAPTIQALAHPASAPHVFRATSVPSTIDLRPSTPIEQIESALLRDPAAIRDFPTEHHFAPGIYCRTVRVPAGTFIVGHRHRAPSMNLVMQGRARVFVGGQVLEIAAPTMFLSGAERKVALVLEDLVWVNVHPNPDDERDMDILEERYIEKSASFLDYADETRRALAALAPQHEGNDQ